MTYNESDAPAVEAEINYLAPGSAINRRFVSAGEEVNTGSYEAHKVIIRDARPQAAEFTLASHGFMLTAHKSAIKDFLDYEEVNAHYAPEVAHAVKRLTGADYVATIGAMVRSSGDRSQDDRDEGAGYYGGVQPPAGEAHVDAAPDRVDQLAAQLYRQQFPDKPPYKRYIYSSFWRVFSDPPQDSPLALCDGRSVGDDEGVVNTMFIVDKIPDRHEMLAPIEGEDQAMAAAIFLHQPHHRWWYFSKYEPGRGVAIHIP